MSSWGAPWSPYWGGNSPDDFPPQVVNVFPPALDSVDPATTVSFDVIDDVGLLCVFVYVIYADLGEAETIHDGDNFMPRFTALSSRVPITGGFRYTLRRSGGWRTTPGKTQANIDVRIRAFDMSGKEAS